MVKRLFNPLIARFAAVAALLILALVAPAVFAEEHDEPCSMDGTAVTCSYDEKGTDAVADFSAMDPEEEGIVWDAEGIDRDAFDITGGVLTFKTSPNFEMPSDVDDPGTGATDESGDNIYEVTVKATEVLTTDQDPPALSSTLTVTVTVTDVNEDGSISLDRLQPQAGAVLTASFSDPDRGAAGTTDPTNTEWLWSVPKVSRPVTETDEHWQPAGIGTSTTDAAAYTPDPADVGKILRVKVSYNDAQSSTDTRPLYMLSYHEVRAEPAANDPPVFDSNADFDASVPEDTAVGTVVGVPVTATDANSGDILSYTLTGADAASFEIDIGTGVIKTAARLDHEDGSADNDGAYEVTVNAFDPSNDTDDVDVTITATDVNEAPTVTGSATGTIPEINSTPPSGYTYTAFASAAYTAADLDDGDTATLGLSGDDEELFEIAAGVVTFKAAPDFEDPKDASLNNSYNINVVAEDVDGLTDMLAVTITVTNVDEDGDVTLSTDQPAIGVPITAKVSDPDNGITGEKWQWASADTAGGTFVNIDGATSATFTPRAAVEDDPDTDDNEAMASDEGKFLQATVMYRDKISPDNDPALNEVVMASPFYAVRAKPLVNTAPMFASATMTREVNENETVNAGDPVTATDAEDDSIEYSISGGADMDKFSIDPDTGQIEVGSATFDYDDSSVQQAFEVEVTASDPFGESSSTMVTIIVINVNEAPELEGDVPEDGYPENDTGPVATFTASDPEKAGIIWDLEDVDNGKFDITGGVLTFKSPPNFEMPGDEARAEVTDSGGAVTVAANAAGNNEYVLTVVATEMRAADAVGNALVSRKPVTVTVTDVNEDGTATINLRQPEVSQATALSVSFSDPDVGQDPATPAALGSPTYQWSVPKVSRPVTDNDDHWQPAASSTTTVARIYTPALVDEGEFLRVKVSYTDEAGTETRSVYAKSEFATRATPTGNVAPIFDPGGDYARSVPEDAGPGTLVGAPVTSGDPNTVDSGKLTYSIPTTGDAAPFAINKATGQISVTGELDQEAGGADSDGAYTVTVKATDPSGLTDTQDVEITADDVNEAPTVGDSSTTPVTSFDENQDETTVLGTYAGADVDDGDEAELSLGGDDAGAFALDADDGELRFAASPNFESPTNADNNNAYKVTIVATDGDGLTDEEALTIKVNNVDEGGEVTLSNSFQPTIGRPMVATLTDDDGGINGAMWQWQSSTTETGTYADIEGATSDTYTPKEAVEDIEATEDVDESAPSDEGLFLRVTVTYRDEQSIDDDESTPDYEEGRRGIDDPNVSPDAVGEAPVLATSVNAVRKEPVTNADPMFPASVTREVEENTAAGSNVGAAVEATDADGDTLTYSISGGADMASFDMPDSGTGQITVGAGTLLDFEGDQRTYMVEVTAEDPFDGVGTVMVTIMVTDVNEAPTLTLGGTPTPTPDPNNAPEFADDAATRSVDENTAAGMAVGAPVTATDADTDDTLTYTLGGADMASFDIDSATGQIMTSAALDYESQSSYTVMVTASDGEDSDSTTVTIMVANVGLDNAYDADDSGTMERSEVIAVIQDYFADRGPTRQQVIEVIQLYFS